jgi:hypothetical protein
MKFFCFEKVTISKGGFSCWNCFFGYFFTAAYTKASTKIGAKVASYTLFSRYLPFDAFLVLFCLYFFKFETLFF